MDFSRHSRAASSAVCCLILQNFKPNQDIMVVLITFKNDEDPIKNEGVRVFTRFSPLKPYGSYLCHGNQSSEELSLSQTGSTLARTNLWHFAWCTLELNHNFYLNILCDHCLHDSGLYIQKILTNREMVNFQKLDFLRFLTANSVTTGAQELNRTSVISLATHN